MLEPDQLRKIWQLSDETLYPEAVAFIRQFVKGEEGAPLPNSQVMGLLNIASSDSYAELGRFIRHQRDRNWQEKKRHIKLFYEYLEKIFMTMRNKRIKDEFSLLRAGLSRKEETQQMDEIMLLLARDFIQHLIAENGVLAAQESAARLGRK
ncbi:hypothetical protein EPA93_22835 [Ktedonosporobacter rubrisoli]|uniref:Uncharacterized protein n=1 Tax=Ktedonosporobacter rubrisoli TaxID=2509675 RepID=A0A4P6JSY4_KTERU|nr:hypothetical protein [Ktedonosporobacter rubrisoli]QBD78667.1 hypothetical protein EPA93_22835 [Ktedonosporobacter rubrisoli]